MHYRSDATLNRDVESLAAIVRLRAGTTSRHVETCKAILLTSNAPLAKISAEQLGSGRQTDVPPCISDVTLTTLLWLKSPSLAPDLPRKWLLADCYAALSPTPQLWERYVQELDKAQQTGTIDADAYQLLRYNASAYEVLMDVTRGEEDAITQSTPGEMRQHIEDRIRADEREKAQQHSRTLEHYLEDTRIELEAVRLREIQRY